MTARRSCGIFVFAAVLLLAALASAQTAVIRGVVRDPSGEAIDEVTVTAESATWGRSEESQTNDSGRFSFIGLQPGQWLFVVRKRGYQPAQGFANVRRTGESGVIQFEMEFDPLRPPAPATGLLAGIRADDLQAALDAAHALFDRGEFDAAIEAYEGVLSRVPQLTSVHLQIGHAHREKRDYEQALTAYQAVPTDSLAGAEARLAIEALAGETPPR